MRISSLAIVLGLALSAPISTAVGPVQARAAETSQLDPARVVAEVRSIISKRYVILERRAALDAVLAEGLSSGRYKVTDPGVLAQRINGDLQATGRDGHLFFIFDPSRAKMLAAPPAAAGAAAAADADGFAREARAANHGVTELRVLPGNVRYMAYDGMMWIGPESAAALETAMRFLAGGDAIIIDIRRAPGGDSDGSRYLISHFMPPGRPLFTYHREDGRVSKVSTLDAVPAGRITGKPLYLLISGDTASAAEELAGNFAGYRVGEVVGEKTAGGGYAADQEPIADQFVLSVSIGRVVLASTGRDWEGVGISPTIPTAPEQALDAAHLHALRRMIASAKGGDRERLEAVAEAVSARLEGRVPALPLAAYAGGYGERSVMLRDGKLYYRRPAGVPVALIPLGANRFALDGEPGLHLAFTLSGKGPDGFSIVRVGGGSAGTYRRTAGPAG